MAKKQNQDQLYEMMVQTMSAASKLPLVRVDREVFLRQQFKDSPYLDTILAKGPQAVYDVKGLRKKADEIINAMTTQTSLVSFAAGIPANPITAVAAGTADVVQYFGFSLNLAQQIAYLFGEAELFDDKNNLSREAELRIIAYLGVMFGAGGASVLLHKVAKQAGQNIGKKVAQKALAKTVWYPLVKKVGAVIGYKITKKTVEKTIANAVPLLGGVISGGLTFITFRPMGDQLANTFVKQLNGEFDTELELNEAFAQSLKEQKELGIEDAEFYEVTK